MKPLSLYHSVRQYAKRHSIPFEIQVEDIEIPEICSVTNKPLNDHGPSCSPSKPVLNCLDWSKGYIPGNIEVISRKGRDLKMGRRKKLRSYASKAPVTLPTINLK